MKQALAIIAMTLVSVPALAHPGGHTLSCKSTHGAKQVVELALSRANGVGWSAPSFTITVDGVAHEFTADDEMKAFGSTVHDSPRGLIEVIADSRENASATTSGGFTVTAIRRTVKAFDPDGNRVTWHAADAADECHDSNGSARFRAMFHGWLSGPGGRTTLATQVLDCELEYDSGMAC